MGAITKNDLRTELERLAAGELGRTIASHLIKGVREDVIKTLRSTLDTACKAEFHASGSDLLYRNLLARGVEAHRPSSARPSERSEMWTALAARHSVARSTSNDILDRHVDEAANSNELRLNTKTDSKGTAMPSSPTDERSASNSKARGLAARSDSGSSEMMSALGDEAETASRQARRRSVAGRIHDPIDESANANNRMSIGSLLSVNTATDRMRRHHINSAVNYEAFAELHGPRNSRLTNISEEFSENCETSKSKPTVQSIVEHPAFDYAACALIAANGVTLGLQTNDFATRDDPEDGTPTTYRLLSVIFCVLFTFELAARVAAYKWKFFTMPGWWHFNIFDTALVLLQLFEEFWNMLMGRSQRTMSFAFLRMLRLFASVRVLRIVRILRYIRQLRAIINSITSSMAHIFWTVCLLGIMTYILGVYLADLVATFAHDNDMLAYYFGSVGASVMTLFHSISGGVSWSEPSTLLSDAVSPVMNVIYSFYICFVVFVLLNNINGVFVDAALHNGKKHQDLDTFHLALDLFKQSDRDHDGELTWEEFESQLNSESMKRYFDVVDLDIAEAKTLFSLIDVDGSGKIDANEFVNACFRLRGAAKGIEFAVFVREFYIFADIMKDMSNSFTAFAEQFTVLETDVRQCRRAMQFIQERITAQALHQGTAPERSARSGDGDSSRCGKLASTELPRPLPRSQLNVDSAFDDDASARPLSDLLIEVGPGTILHQSIGQFKQEQP